MPKTFATEAARVAAELRAVGIPARLQKTNKNVIVLPSFTPDDLIVLRLIHPALQKLSVQIGIKQ